MTTEPTGRVASTDLPAGKATVNVAPGGISKQTIVVFNNCPGGVVTSQVRCK